MPTLEARVQRFSIVSSNPFDEIIGRLTASIGRPEINAFHSALIAAKTMVEFESVVQAAIGDSELMEFIRFDAGEILRKESGEQGAKILRIVVGNPIVMKEMVRIVPDAASYAPVTILIDERADGVHLSYDSMASQIAPYRSEAALAVAAALDAKVVGLLEAAVR
jgi:hypothetical protein